MGGFSHHFSGVRVHGVNLLPKNTELSTWMSWQKCPAIFFNMCHLVLVLKLLYHSPTCPYLILGGSSQSIGGSWAPIFGQFHLEGGTTLLRGLLGWSDPSSANMWVGFCCNLVLFNPQSSCAQNQCPLKPPQCLAKWLVLSSGKIHVLGFQDLKNFPRLFYWLVVFSHPSEKYAQAKMGENWGWRSKNTWVATT